MVEIILLVHLMAETDFRHIKGIMELQLTHYDNSSVCLNIGQPSSHVGSEDLVKSNFKGNLSMMKTCTITFPSFLRVLTSISST